MNAPPAIRAAGLICAAGRTFAEAGEAYAGGGRFFGRAKGIVGRDGMAPILAAAIPFDAERDPLARVAFLFDAALDDCLAQRRGEEEAPPAGYPMFLVLPPWLQDGPLKETFLRHVEARCRPPCGEITAYAGGPAESLIVIGDVALAIQAGRFGGAFVCALDSHLSCERLDHLAITGCSLAADHPHGFIPGEAAAAILLTDGSRSPAAPGHVLAAAWDRESERPDDPERGVLGRGLRRCYHGLGKPPNPALPQRPPGRLLADLNGERWRAEDFGFAVSGMGAPFADLAADPETPALALGDVGAATGAVMTALALVPPPGRKRPAETPGEKPPTAILSAASRSGARAALMIGAADPGDPSDA